MINLKMLESVMGTKIKRINETSIPNYIIFFMADGDIFKLNKYQVANQCKSWAHSEGFMIQSYPYNNLWRADLLKGLDVDEIFKENSEEASIFKASTWAHNWLKANK